MTALRMLMLLTLVCGVIYPLVLTGLASILFPKQAAGSLILQDGKLAGSELIGQHTEDPRYFWPRLSATPEFPFNPAASSGSNYGPLNPKRAEQAERRRAALRAADPENTAPIACDLLTSSGSGLDPHISPQAAEFQSARVARFRGAPLDLVRALVQKHTRGRQFGVLGEPVVNILLLNQDLDREWAGKRE